MPSFRIGSRFWQDGAVQGILSVAGGLGQISDWQSLIIGRSLVTVTGSWRNWSGRWRTRFRWPRRLREPAQEDCNLLTVFGTIIVNSARLCPWVSGLPWAGRPAFRITKTSQAAGMQDAPVSEWPSAARTSPPWWLSRSVINPVGPVGCRARAERINHHDAGWDVLRVRFIARGSSVSTR